MESFPTVASWESKAGKDSKERDVRVLQATENLRCNTASVVTRGKWFIPLI